MLGSFNIWVAISLNFLYVSFLEWRAHPILLNGSAFGRQLRHSCVRVRVTLKGPIVRSTDWDRETEQSRNRTLQQP